MTRSFTIILLVASIAAAAAAQVIPESRRSRESIERVRPLLVQELNEKELRLGNPIFVRIFKESRELELWVQGTGTYELFKKYDICAASGDLGPKLEEGDNQSPEGFYFVTPEQLNPSSSYHLSFNLGYPNVYDRFHRRTGSALMVHGRCVSIGCYAMTDPAIEEIYAMVDAAFRGGQPFFRVHVFPFRLSDTKLQQERNSGWVDFWRNLQTGYDYFEREGHPPNVTVSAGKYVFGE